MNSIKTNKLAFKLSGHHSIHFVYNDVDLIGFVIIHQKIRNNPSFGATRLYPYSNLEHALLDGLRLSEAMTYKSMILEEPYGGAKCTLMCIGNSKKDELLNALTVKLIELKSNFVTGADVGLIENDVIYMKKQSVSVVGLSSDPVHYTALGVLNSIKASLPFSLIHTNSLNNCKVAIQGLGKVGWALAGLLVKAGCTVIATDTNFQLVERARKMYPGIILVQPEAIYRQKVDVFCPCAMSGTISETTLEVLQAKVVVGAANNQLSSVSVATSLQEKEILYVPDFVANSGGLAAVILEYQGSFNELNVKKKLDLIDQTVNDVIKSSLRLGISTDERAREIAINRLQNYLHE